MTAATAPTSLGPPGGSNSWSELSIPPRLASLAVTSACMRPLSRRGRAGYVRRQPVTAQETTETHVHEGDFSSSRNWLSSISYITVRTQTRSDRGGHRVRGPLIIGRGEWLLVNRPRADTNDGSWPDTGRTLVNEFRGLKVRV